MKSEVLELSRVYCRYLQAVKVLQVLRSVLQAVKSVCRYYIFFYCKALWVNLCWLTCALKIKFDLTSYLYHQTTLTTIIHLTMLIKITTIPCSIK